MNKPPQPIAGPTSVPNPAPSPGLTQAAYGPGQPTSLVFATPPPPQMNSAPQPRQFATGPRTLHQQSYYQNRPTMATSAPRVPGNSGPRAVAPAHVYPPGSQMMMISQPFAGSPQGYFIPSGQYRAPYMPPTQQYPVTSGTANFYTGTSPAEYPPYEPSLAARERRGGGGRGGGRENGRLSLHGAPLASQRYPDPNQGGRDITHEILSGVMSSTTPTPQVRLYFEVTELNRVMMRPTSAETPPSLAAANAEPVLESKQEVDSQIVLPTELAAQSVAPVATTEVPSTLIKDQQSPPSLPPGATLTTTPAEAVNKVGTTSSEAPEAPVKIEELPAAPAQAEKGPEKEEAKTEEVKKVEKEEQVATTKLEPATQNAVLRSTPEPESTQVEAAEPVLPNGLPQETEELPKDNAISDTTPHKQPDASQSQESTPMAKTATAAQEVKEEAEEREEEEECKKKKNLIFSFFLQEQGAKPASEPMPTQANPPAPAPAELPVEVADETWEQKEDKQNAEPDKSKATPEPTEQKYQYKQEEWKPINPEDKKRYDREFLLGCQFISASMHKPEGLPIISDVVLDKVNKTPLRPADPSRLMNTGPDFTPSYLGNLGSRSVGGPRGPPSGPRRSQTKKIITSMSLNDDVQLSKAEKAWKPSVKKVTRGRVDEPEEEDPEQAKTRELFKRLRSILNKLTPQKFQELMKQVTELTIDTEERLKGAIDLIFEKAISEPNFSVAYANMCRCLMGLKVPTSDKPGVFVNFRKLLLNRCQKEFEKDQDDDEIFEKKQKELEAAKDGEERERFRVELEEARDKARRRSLGNIKFIGELFKLKMLTEPIMHDCVVKLLKNHDEESLECLCRLLSTIGKDLDFEKAKPRMDQYFNQMDKIIKERKTSSRIRFMLQDVLDLRRNNWVPRRGDQGPKTIDQIHKEAEMEEHREQMKVQQQLMTKKESRDRFTGNMGSRGPHTPGGGRTSQPQDEGWNTVPISKNRPIDTTRLSKITKPGAMDFNNQLLAPGGKGMWGSWGKGSSGGTGAKPASGDQDSGRPGTSTLNRFSALQSGSLMSATDSDRRVPQRSSSSRERGSNRDRSDRNRDRFDRFDRSEGREANQVTKRSFSRESQERGGRGGDGRSSTESVRRVASMTDSRDRGSRDRGSRDRGIKRESAPTPPPSLPKPALTEEEVEKKSHAIIEEYLHINDVKEALQCVVELNSTSLLYVFVRNGLESTLERSTIAREHMGLLLHQLIKAGTLPTQQYYKGLLEILEVAEDMAIDIPHIWLYLAELITPMLHEGGIPMGQLFREISKPLVPLGKASVLLVQILKYLIIWPFSPLKTPNKVGALWTEAGLNWNDFLPKDEDVNKFVTDQKVEFTVGEEMEPKEASKKKVLSGEEISKQLDRLLQDKANNQRIRDWIEANLDEQQTASNQFVRALMTSVCQSAIICDNPYKVDAQQIGQRASLLQRYLYDEQKELQALYALQALMVHMEQPAHLLRMFFDALYDEDVIKEEAFYEWETSKDPAEQTGKGVALKSVTGFFTWLREAEEESDKE
uniref:Eukaryotic translation initiation factor 4 gamma, 1a n=1 Tax=Astatotilapia calliptera TaxID=8154 RepID=A0AAX7VK32_ASTCA